MPTIAELPTPALLLDLDVLERNLTRMAERARRLGVALRPHLKTHKCVQVAERQRALGARGVTVSTLPEARVFADHGFDDITWAFPVILGRLDEARALADRVTLRFVVDGTEAVEALGRSGYPFHVWLKVDSGYHRAGVDPDAEDAVHLAEALARSPHLRFDGILTHSGHAYAARGRAALAAVAEAERRVMADFADRLRRRGIEVPAVSVGSTPAMSAAESLEGVTEARPGNYALYDYAQTVIGSCGPEDCAVTVLASVVSSRPGARRSVVDAGALALSKDLGPGNGSPATFGEILDDDSATPLRGDTRVVSLSQEHGVVNAPLPLGSRIRIVPNHSCLTVACFDEFHVVRGQEVIDRWKIWRVR
jgi:D-serine deaminase-like pyridoxal phosphate-dependent protein